MQNFSVVELIIPIVFALLFLIMSILQFLEKGFLLNNAYIYAPKKDRETMNKKPHYRQSTIVFLMLSVEFFIMAVDVVIEFKPLLYLHFIIFTAVIVYAIFSSIKLSKK